MTSSANRIVVTTEDYAVHSVHGFSAHHCEFPEVRGEGSSAEDATARLAEHLSRTLDNAPSDWRRAAWAFPLATIKAWHSLSVLFRVLADR